MEYLTINEAAKITGKSSITIRRLIKSLKEPDIKKQKIRTGYMWLVSKEYLTAHMIVQLNTLKNKYDTIQDEIPSTHGEQVVTQLINLTEFLKSQLQEKDKQIAEINNRLKESNILTLNLQTRLQITDKKPNIFTRLFFKQKE
jgi:hypothetical protein